MWAKQKGLTRIQLEGNCLNVIEALKGKQTSVKWTTHNLIQDALDILSTFNFWSSNYVHRDANHLTDSLAKFARTQVIFFHWLNSGPEWVSSLTQQDKTFI